jgi:cation-transporting P-type ATPase E
VHSQVGLTAREVTDRIANQQTNSFRPPPSRRFLQIVRTNVFTRFNLLLGSLCAVVLIAGSPIDALFGLVILTNSLIGIVQETRAKRTLDALAFLHRPTSHVVRDGELCTVNTGDVVLDDVVLLKSGDEIPADGVVIECEQLEIDESNLTGESEPVAKSVGDSVLSGCFVSRGNGFFRATKVGALANANLLTAEARVFHRTPSEIERGLNTVLRWVGWVIIAAIPLQVVAVVRLDHESMTSGVLRGVAGLVGVVPEGLVLLSTLAFLSAALSLSKRNVLVQELGAVEGLARVDVVCIDKTGTLTTGHIEFRACEILTSSARDDVACALGALANDIDRNATLQAVHEKYPDVARWTATAKVPFDSQRKWKATSFDGHGTWFLGAPEMLAPQHMRVMSRVNELARDGNRVLLLCTSDHWSDNTSTSSDLEPMALVVLRECIRGDARDTVGFFAEQGVRVIVISGDNPVTVGAIARDVGIETTTVIDARALGEDDASILNAVGESSVFGRVTPAQKRNMIHVLQQQGHVVAMTGDGVNDSLALKSADVGIAMGDATPATKAVAQFVLLDNAFSSLPQILGEGRRVIANIERVAQLFLAKNAMSVLAIIVGAISATRFPVLPRQMTLLSTLTIGVPSFFLALAPNARRFTPGFVRRIVSRSLPIGVAIGVSVVASDQLSRDSTGTAATITALVCFFALLCRVAEPFTMKKLVLIASLASVAMTSFAVPWLQTILGLNVSVHTLTVALLCSVPAVVGIGATSRIAR